MKHIFTFLSLLAFLGALIAPTQAQTTVIRWSTGQSEPTVTYERGPVNPQTKAGARKAADCFISIGFNFTQTPLCAGAGPILPNVTGNGGATYNCDGPFVFELSDATGSFASPPLSITGASIGAIFTTLRSTNLPVSLPSGTNYMFRFRYQNQDVVSNAQGPLTIIGASDLTPTASNGGVLTCTNPSSTITAPAGGTNYAFTGPGNFSQSGAGNTADVSGPGTYTVVETLSGGCTATGTITIGENKTPPTNVQLSNDGPLTCTKTSVTLTASSTGGSTYAFTGPNGFSQSGATTASVTAPGTYSVIVTGTNGCSATAQTTPVSSSTAAPDANLSSNGMVNANNPTVTLTASPGGTTYAFSPGATQQGGSSGNTSNTATVTSPGAYQVTVTGANGCTAVGQTTVLGGNSPTVCRGGTATLTVVASGSPQKYEWYKNSVNSARLSEVPYLQTGTATASLKLINVQISASYFVKVTDQNGSVAVYGPFKLTVDASCRGRLAAEESVEPGSGLRLTLLSNPLVGETLRAVVVGAEGCCLRVSLLTTSGQPLREQSWPVADSEQVLEWNVSGHSAGVYILRAVSEAQAGHPAQRQSLKVIKP